MYQANKEKGLIVVGISTSEDAALVKKVAEEKGISFPILIADASVAENFGAEGSPESFLVDSSGNLVERVVGARGVEFFEERAKTLLSK